MNLTSKDVKVKRWSFNVLALIGTPEDVPFLEAAWRDNYDVPEVFEAGLTALATILPKGELLIALSRSGITLSPAVVMALAQQSSSFDNELEDIRLNPSRAGDGELKSATLLIGLQKAPKLLFSPRHAYNDVIGDLNTHSDAIVAQYSFWATVENPDLSLSNVRVPPALFSGLPPNVQAWAYRVLTKTPGLAIAHNELIVEGSGSKHTEVREGVAIGLRDIFFDSLDMTVIDWMLDETDLAIREKLLEHMAAYAGESNGYREEVDRAYRQSSPNSILRARLEAACRDNDLSLDLRKIALQTGDPDLFTHIAGNNVNNTQNFNATVNAGGISNTGTGNEGSVTINNQQEAIQLASDLLKQLLAELHKFPVDEDVTKGKALVEQAIKAPTKGMVATVLGWLKSAQTGTSALAAIGQSSGQIYHGLEAAAHHLPTILT